MGLTMLQIPKPDAPQAAPPLGISPEKLAAVKAAARELEEGMHAGVSPQKLTILLEKFWSAQSAAAPTPEPLGLDSCPSCGGDACPIPGEQPTRRRCTRCGANFSSTRTAVKPCPACQSPLTTRTGGRGAHCNCCGHDFFV